MKLKVRNFAKILKADIEVDGITIIAGNNNIGKSTVGKILDAVFNATYHIDEKMNQARIDSLASMLRREVERNRDKINLRGRHYSSAVYHEFAKNLLACQKEDRVEICKEYERQMIPASRQESDFVERILEHLEDNGKISDKIFSQAIYTDYFSESFHEEINSLYSPDEPAEITVSIKGKEIQLTFKGNECVQEDRQLDIFNSSLYIDDPFVLDEMNNNFTFGISGLSIHKRNVLKKLLQKEDKSVEEKTFSNLLVENKLEDIMQIIDRVAAGEITKKQKYKYQFAEDSSKAIDVASLSTGLKAFLILKQILLNGNLQDKDVIVLDEPEIHLHPEWQLLYAEVIVLLQKKFNFHIIVTTHSAHFMEALELYSKKYGISERCRYYLAGLQDNGAVFENVTENISKIYKQMVDPTLLLSRLREELEAEDDEL